MPGKPYTQKELKVIVDYLKEHRAYNEIRGRKMWVDLANSKIIDRTWQSLKETFLKRILPDIHNPYYKLTVEQISSFRRELDVEAMNKNKLEIRTITDESRSSDNDSSKQKNTDNKKSGEDPKHVGINDRASTETLVLDKCYNTAEEVQRDLESPVSDKEPPKSMRDLITYSEPLTPMLQELIDDFTDDEEPQLQIVEQTEPALEPDVVIKTENTEKPDSLDSIRESQSYNKTTTNDDDNNKTNQRIKSLRLKKTQKGTWENKEPIEEVSSTTETNNNETKHVFAGEEAANEDINSRDKNNTINGTDDTELPNNGTNDTELPNNPEGLNKSDKKRTSTESNNSEFLEPHKKNKKDKSRKRSRSQSSTDPNKKRKSKSKSRENSVSGEKDTQTFDSHPQATDVQKAMAITDKFNAVNKSNVNEGAVKDPNEGTSQEAGPSGVNMNPADLNPCLQSVSLYDEQFSQEKYSDSEVENVAKKSESKTNVANTENPKPKENEGNISEQNKQPDLPVKESANDEALDKHMDVEKSKNESHSEPEESSKNKNEPPSKKRAMGPSKSMKRALANVFGFSNGSASHQRTLKYGNVSRNLAKRRRTKSRNLSIRTESESGSNEDYTTDDSAAEYEYRNSRYRKYVRPPSFDILSDAKDGGIFAVIGNKMYPLLNENDGDVHYAYVKDNAIQEESDSYWKGKYLETKKILLEQSKKYTEEKIRADELARLLIQEKDNKSTGGSTSPILQSNKSLVKANTSSKENQRVQEAPEKETKIKYTYKNTQIELECPTPNVNPIIEKIMAMIDNKETQEQTPYKTEPVIEDKNQPKEASREKTQGENPKEIVKKEDSNKSKQSGSKKAATKRKISVLEPEVISSGKSTPIIANGIDPEVHEKINQIESEIFKEIEEIEKSTVNPNAVTEVVNETNVTKRKRGRPRKVSTSSVSISPQTSIKTSGTSTKTSPALIKTSETSTKTSQASLKSQDGNKSKPMEVESDTGSVASRRTTKAPRRYESETELPVPKPNLRRTQSNQSLNQRTEVSIPDDPTVRYMLPPTLPLPLPLPPTTAASKHVKKSSRRYNTIENPITRCHSPLHNESTQGYQDSDVSPSPVKRKKSSGSLKLRTTKRTPSPYLADDDDTSQSKDSVVSKSIIPNATLDSEVYRSESYQFLVPKRTNFSQLGKINESPIHAEMNKQCWVSLTPLTINVNNEYYIPSTEHRSNLSKKSSEGNSSNISLPPSPELSVVENLSISKETISTSPENHPTLNELQVEIENPLAELNKYLINDVDVSVPLMEQDCELKILGQNKSPSNNSMSESILNEVYTVDMEEHSCSDSLDRKLRDLLLESAKKMAQMNTEPIDKENHMEIDVTEVDDKKARAKKRCSTPRKKKTAVTSKTPNIEPVLEEHTESCSINRRSCPPVINIIPCADKIDVNSNVPTKIDNNRGRKKKDVIKVKILRPRDKSGSRDRAHGSLISIFTDSGINDNDSLSMCNSCNGTTELIHNHSETCLNLDECVGNSIEFIASATKSIITLDSNSGVCDSPKDDIKSTSNEEFLTPELFCTNAMEATAFSNSEKSPPIQSSDEAATVYHTPPSNTSFNSIITEDLSDESSQKPSKWYLLTELETNFEAPETSTGGTGSNLVKIFPITCAVPNLSTITENSRDNDSKPPSLDTENSTQFPSIFNP